WIVLGAVMTLTATIAWASLGQTNPLHIPASARSTIPTSTARVISRSMPDNVQIRSSTGPHGIKVQEYIGADGSLFAVTWAGPQRVDAKTVVTHFFPQVHADGGCAAHSIQAVVRSVRQSWGNEGVAYLPSLMPMDFDPNALAP
ncbi:MAG: DUF2844 domain-containing protein, partial [Thiomonas sp.]